MQNGTNALRILLQIALPYRRQFSFMALLALTATSLDLIEPLIYRAAVNDVAGLSAGLIRCITVVGARFRLGDEF